MSPRFPAFVPWYSAPWAWQASSITGRSRSFAASRIGSISAVCPYRCTGMTAAVLRVTASGSFAGSIVYADPSISTNTGRAPTSRTVEAEAMKESGGTRTSCPAGMPWARSAR